MVKLVPLTEVKIGMCLAESVKDKQGKEIYQANFYFTSREQMVNLLDNGITQVKIDMLLSLNDYSARQNQPQKPTVDGTKPDDPVERFNKITKFIPEIKEIFDTSEKVVKESMLAVRYGGALDRKAVQNEAGKILKMIQLDPQMCFALLDLKNFDEYTYIHSINVAVLSVAFALGMRYSEDRLLSLAQGSILHDIGKAKIPLDIINKPDSLSKEEMEIVRQHPELGVQVIQKDSIRDEIVEEIIHFHHENFDGTGYPNKVQGINMKRYAAIVSVADYYDALTSKRVYKEKFDPHEAIKLIYQGSGTKFDPRVVNHFIRIVGIYPIGSLVELSDGRIATVVGFSNSRLLEPTVKTLFYKNMPHKMTSEVISLQGSGIYIKNIYKDSDFKTIDAFSQAKPPIKA